jgi:DNA-binding LytR/AlgR family response regulator
MKEKFNILILDDEILALSYLKDILEDFKHKATIFSNFDIIGTTNQTEFWSILEENLPQIVFLDIQMPRHSGLEIAKEIREKSLDIGYKNEQLPLIIFTTAHENYGYLAFKVNALDYILKPIDEEKIEQILHKISANYTSLLQPTNEKIIVNSSGIDIEIPLQDILYFKADMKYIAVITLKKEFLINDTLLNLEEKFPKFIKTHRAFLVNPNYINSFHKKDNHWFLTIKEHNIHLPISRRQKPEIEKKIDYKVFFSD